MKFTHLTKEDLKEFGKIPNIKTELGLKRLFNKKDKRGNSKDYYANHLDVNETGKVDILVGAFMLIKGDVYNEVNGFDEDYFMYGEDIDLSYKVLKSILCSTS